MNQALAARPDERPGEPFETALVSDPNLLVDPPPSNKASVRDVAKLAKVSVATVSLVINENPRISQPTQLRVRRAMKQLGYLPNRLAQNLSRRDTRVLAVMLPSLSHSFADRYFGELMSGISDRAVKLGYKMLVEQATPEFIKERVHIELFERRFVDGVLCLGNSDRHPFLTDFSVGHYPMIVVNNYFPQWAELDCVVCDYRGGAEQAMNYLFQLGHRRIGMISGSARVQTARDVVDTYEARLRDAGIDPLPTWREDGLFTELGGAEAASRLIAHHPELTAILCGNDKMAMGAIHYLAQSGRRVPQDVSIVGFDDMQHAEFVNPALTTVHLPLYEVGVLACEKLVNRIQGRDEKVRDTLATHLVVRNSTGIAPQ
jgi:LacI family transcriptional regulator